MSKLREYIGNLTNDELWALFDEMQEFEKTTVVSSSAMIRDIAETHFVGNSILLAINIVGFETCRELALRGAAHTKLQNSC